MCKLKSLRGPVNVRLFGVASFVVRSVLLRKKSILANDVTLTYREQEIKLKIQF